MAMKESCNPKLFTIHYYLFAKPEGPETRNHIHRREAEHQTSLKIRFSPDFASFSIAARFSSEKGLCSAHP